MESTASSALIVAEGVEKARGRGVDRALLSLFTAATFLGALLVFLVQPIAAKMLLPLFGGSAAVWITAVVFFQAVLLGGYLYAHVSTRLLGPRRQRLLHAAILLLPLAVLPIGQRLSAPPAGSSPELWLLGMLALAVGLPFFAVTTASPVLQRWFSVTEHPAARDPYFLYAAGNAGSLLALLAYPFLVEPWFTLDEQADVWSLAYVAFALLSAACALTLARGPAASATSARVEDRAVAPPAWRTRARWVFMAFVPSSLMLGATAYISTDIAAVPLLWIAPLAVYLLTFIVAFSRRPLVPAARAGQALPLVAAGLVPMLLGAVTPPVAVTVALQLALVFLAGTLAHGRLALERPAPERLTEFYVLLSVGGVLGGVFNALVAPLVFDSVLEYPLVVVLALFLRPGRRAPARSGSLLGRTADVWVPALYLFGLLGALAVLPAVAGGAAGSAAVALLFLASFGALAFVRRPVRFALAIAALLSLTLAAQPAVHAERTFYGVLRVVEKGGERTLVHGRTLHGSESLTAAYAGEPLTYYGRRGPIGEAMRELQRGRPFSSVSVIGLGVGSLAAYGRPGQTYTFYELDPAVVEIASDARWFTFLRDSRARIETVVGDGRRTLAAAPPSSSDLLVVDAFSSDSIPVHLLTLEALDLYFAKLRSGGVLAVHISNRYLDLGPVLAAGARARGLAALERTSEVSAQASDRGEAGSRWVVLARDPGALAPLRARGWQRLADTGARPWTDDFSNVLAVLDWL